MAAGYGRLPVFPRIGGHPGFPGEGESKPGRGVGPMIWRLV